MRNHYEHYLASTASDSDTRVYVRYDDDDDDDVNVLIDMLMIMKSDVAVEIISNESR